jgi:hypothetical protein
VGIIAGVSAAPVESGIQVAQAQDLGAQSGTGTHVLRREVVSMRRAVIRRTALCTFRQGYIYRFATRVSRGLRFFRRLAMAPAYKITDTADEDKRAFI